MSVVFEVERGFCVPGLKEVFVGTPVRRQQTILDIKRVKLNGLNSHCFQISSLLFINLHEVNIRIYWAKDYTIASKAQTFFSASRVFAIRNIWLFALHRVTENIDNLEILSSQVLFSLFYLFYATFNTIHLIPAWTNPNAIIFFFKKNETKINLIPCLLCIFFDWAQDIKEVNFDFIYSCRSFASLSINSMPIFVLFSISMCFFDPILFGTLFRLPVESTGNHCVKVWISPKSNGSTINFTQTTSNEWEVLFFILKKQKNQPRG